MVKNAILQLLAIVAVASSVVHARVVPINKAPYIVKRDGQPYDHITPPDLSKRVLNAGKVGESVIHKRVTNHLRPTYDVTRQEALQAHAGNPAAHEGPQPVRGEYGYPYIHPGNTEINKQNPTYVHSPSTDEGHLPNMKWSFSLSHTRLLKGGWVREQTVTDLPISTQVSSAELVLAPYAFRELHWHRVSEWAYVFNGTVRLTGIDQDGGNYIEDVKAGDLWAFPQGVPHTLQAGPEGASFLLVFDDGDFDATGTTFMVDDWIAHTPKDVLAANFGWNASVFDQVPQSDPYMVPGKKEQWTSLEEARESIGASPDGQTSTPFAYSLSKQEPSQAPGGGGWVKVVDYRHFNATQTLASAFVHVEPGALRELHWHRNVEWGYVVRGRGRATAFAGPGRARSFDVQAGDTWLFTTNFGHYIQNVDDEEPLEFIEILRGHNFGDQVRFNEFSLLQWLALNPPEYVAQQLNVSVDLVKQLRKEKQQVIAAPSRKP
jgi:oxalate decarboxylase family bicupin protein